MPTPVTKENRDKASRLVYDTAARLRFIEYVCRHRPELDRSQITAAIKLLADGKLPKASVVNHNWQPQRPRLRRPMVWVFAVTEHYLETWAEAPQSGQPDLRLVKSA